MAPSDPVVKTGSFSRGRLGSLRWDWCGSGYSSPPPPPLFFILAAFVVVMAEPKATGQNESLPSPFWHI